MKSWRAIAAFTLIELLTVIAIVGLLAALAAPTLNNFRKGDAMLSATRAMLDGVAYGRQLAISQHTTVYMVFVPTNFWDNTLYPNATAFSRITAPAELIKVTNILDKQLTGFTFVSLRSIGDQPGQGTPRYLTEWQTLPDKSFIAGWKFSMTSSQTNFIGADPNTGLPFPVTGFNTTTLIPFPSDQAPYVNPPIAPYITLPYIAFDYQGRLVLADGTPLGRDEFIPLAHGAVSPARDSHKQPTLGTASVNEQVPGNSSSSAYNLIHIDWLTGRARLEQQQVK